MSAGITHVGAVPYIGDRADASADAPIRTTPMRIEWQVARDMFRARSTDHTTRPADKITVIQAVTSSRP